MDICRVCMDEVDNFSSIFESFDSMKKELTPATLISDCCGISIGHNDGLPELICSTCLQAIVQAHTIREKCIASDRKLRKILCFRNTTKHLTEPKVKIEQEIPPEPIDVVEEVLQIVGDEDRNNQHTVSQQDGAGQIKFEQFAITPSLIISEEGYDGQDTYEPDVEIKEVADEENGTYCDEEYLMEQVAEQCKEEMNETAPFDFTKLLDNKTIAMEVEIVKPPQRNRDMLEDDTKDGNSYDAITKKFVCDLCKKKFSTKGNLKSHLKLHSNERPYSCERCGRKFSKKSNYDTHLVRHSNHRTIPCTMCDMWFACNINLKNHMKKHTGVRPYVCQDCKKTFMYLSDYKRHRYFHTGDYPFKCELCGKPFNRESLLTKHNQGRCPVKHDYKRKEPNRKEKRM